MVERYSYKVDVLGPNPSMPTQVRSKEQLIREEFHVTPDSVKLSRQFLGLYAAAFLGAAWWLARKGVEFKLSLKVDKKRWL